jgi:hypothetical protein
VGDAPANGGAWLREPPSAASRPDAHGVRYGQSDRPHAPTLTGEDLSHDDPSIEEGRLLLLRQLQWAADRGRAFVAVVNG